MNFYDCAGQYEEQWFDSQSDFGDATPITVTDGLVTEGVDATMVEIAPFGSISGTVLNEANEPIPDICVLAVDFSLLQLWPGVYRRERHLPDPRPRRPGEPD